LHNQRNAIFYFNATDDKFYLTDGTNTISSAAQTFAEHDVLYLVATWDAGGLNIYKNGVNIASGNSYVGTTLYPTYVGADDSIPGANHALGTIMDFTLYNEQISAAEAAAIYADQYRAITAHGYLHPIPVVTSKLTARSAPPNYNQLTQANDSTHQNHLIIHGIPGSANARTLLRLTTTSVPYNGAGKLSIDVADEAQSFRKPHESALCGKRFDHGRCGLFWGGTMKRYRWIIRQQF